MRKIAIDISFQDEGIVAEIFTENMYLRVFQEEDFEDAVKIYSDEKLTRFFDFGRPYSIQEIEKIIKERAYSISKKGIPLGIFSAFDLQSGDFVGHFDLIPINSFKTVEIGCILKREFHHKGLGLEGAKVLVCEYIKELNRRGFQIEKVIATTHPKNFPSIAILKSIGMNREKKGFRFGSPRIWYGYNVH